MFDPAPSTWLGAGYDVDTGTHVISLNTNDAASNKLLAQLTDALADPTTGDIRSVMFAVLEAFYTAWRAVADADHPTKMTITRSRASGTGDTLRYNYQVSFLVDSTEIAVTAE